MSEITRVALDAMGGDNAPGEILKKNCLLILIQRNRSKL